MGSCISTNTYEGDYNRHNDFIYKDDRTNDEMSAEEVMDRQTRQMIRSMKGKNGFD